MNAVANRSFEHAREWVRAGANVDVITDVPHFPEGRVYQGYRNRPSSENVDGIEVTRVPSYIAANRRKIRRIFSYISYMASAVVFSRKLKRKPDVILATSPQIFTAVAGYVLSLWHRAPFVMEVRDLWPQSIRAVGAFRASFILWAVQLMVDFLYKRAERIIIVSEAFREEIESSGVSSEKIEYIPNGFCLDEIQKLTGGEENHRIRQQYNLNGKFVVSYIGTLGMAHALETVVDAARTSSDPEVLFLIAGTGSNRDALQNYSEGVANFKLLPKLPRDEALRLLQASDVSFIHLKDTPVFQTVLPSKMFEAMALKKPIILGVRGEAERLVRQANAGICIPPEDAGSLNEAIGRLRKDQKLQAVYGGSGSEFLIRNHDRKVLARRTLELFKRLKYTAPRTQ